MYWFGDNANPLGEENPYLDGDTSISGGLLGSNPDSPWNFWNKVRDTGSNFTLRNLGSSLFNLGKGGPNTRSVEGQGAFTDLNRNQVWDQGENYDPASSVWNGWMSAQNTMQDPGDPTTAGLGYVPKTQPQQDYQNALTMADYTDTPLSAEQQEQYASAANPKHTWKTEMASGNDWLGDLF